MQATTRQQAAKRVVDEVWYDEAADAPICGKRTHGRNRIHFAKIALLCQPFGINYISNVMGNYLSFTETPKHLQRSSRTKSVIWTFEDFTEDAPEDDKIKRGVQGLQQRIFQHAHIFYRKEEVRYTPTSIEEILKKDSQVHPNFSTSEFAHLLCDPRCRRSAICSYISHMVTKNMEFSGSQSDTLLVPSVLQCMAELEIGDPHVKLSEGMSHCYLIPIR